MKKRHRTLFGVFMVLLLALTGCTLTNNNTSSTDASVDSSSQQTKPSDDIDTTTSNTLDVFIIGDICAEKVEALKKAILSKARKS